VPAWFLVEGYFFRGAAFERLLALALVSFGLAAFGSRALPNSSEKTGALSIVGMLLAVIVSILLLGLGLLDWFFRGFF